MDKSFLAFIIADLIFITLSILLGLLGVYFTTAIGWGALIAIIAFLFYDLYFFRKVIKTIKHGNA